MKKNLLMLLSFLMLGMVGAQAQRLTGDEFQASNLKYYFCVTSLNAAGEPTTGQVDQRVDNNYVVTVTMPSSTETLSSYGMRFTTYMKEMRELFGDNQFRSHQLDMIMGMNKDGIDFHNWIKNSYAFKGATFNVIVDEKTVVYTYGAATEQENGESTITGTPSSAAAAEAAWYEFCDHVAVSTQAADNSFVKIVDGSYIINGEEYAALSPLNMTDLTDFSGNIDKIIALLNIQSATGSTCKAVIKAGTQFAIGTNVFTLKSDCTITMPDFLMEGLLQSMKDAFTEIKSKQAGTAMAYMYMYTTILGFDEIIGKVDAAENPITVDIQFPGVVNPDLSKEQIEEILPDASEEEVEAVQETLDNDNVKNYETNMDDAADVDDIVELLKEAAPEAGADPAEITSSSDITRTIQVDLTSAVVESTTSQLLTTYTVTGMTFDVKPYVTTIVDGVKVTALLTNDKINEPITFRLPIDVNTTATSVEIFHQTSLSAAKTSLGYFTIQGDELTGKYVELSAKEFSYYSYSLVNSIPTSLTVYEGNSTAQTMTVAEWNAALAEYPNAVAVITSEYADWAAEQTNVLVKYSVGAKGTYYECPKFVLTDRDASATSVNFYTPVNFTAVSGSYTRNLNANTSTCCLPFAVKSSMVSGKILTFAYYEPIYESGVQTEGAYVYFNNRTTSGIDAGTPCLLFSNSARTFTANFNNTEIVANPDNSGNMQGTYQKKVLDDDYCYGVDAAGTKLAKVDGAETGSFRSVLSLNYTEMYNGGSNHTSAPEAARPQFLNIRIIGEDGETTGIDGVAVETAKASQNGAIYNINGARVSQMGHGMYIVNGKKVIK